MTPQQFETEVMNLLRIPFARPDDPGLVQRLNKLKAVFQAVDDPAEAVALYERLSAENPQDAFAREFHNRLAASTRRDLLAILLASKASPQKQAPSPPRSQEYRLVDEDAKTVRTIAHSDPEYQERFVNHHIANVTSDPNPNTFEFHSMVVHYDDGRELELPLDAVPVRTRIPGMILVRIKPYAPPIIDHYVLRKGTIIPMNSADEMMLSQSTTPDLVDFRTTIEYNIRQRHQLLELAMLTHTFAGLVGANISFLHFSMAVSSEPGGMFVRSQKTGKAKPPGGSPPDASYRVNKQYKQVTARDLLMWEQEGGHSLGRHNPELTKAKLLERVVGEKVVAVPPTQSNHNPTDFSVWQGKQVSAASKWADQATMNKAIGQIIHQNIDEIRRVTTGGGTWKAENQAVGYKTGSGWVKTGVSSTNQAQDRGVFWDENLKGMTIVIEPRKNHIPTAQDPEGWYVHTAFPDRAR